MLAQQQSRSTAALAATVHIHAGDEARHPPMALMAATGAVLVAATLWQERKSADCCGIAGVVGTKGHDAR